MKFSVIRYIYQGSRLKEIVGLTSLISHLSGISILPCLKSSVLAKVVSCILSCFFCCFKGMDKLGSCYSILGRSKAFYISPTICSYFWRNMKDRYPNHIEPKNELHSMLLILILNNFSELLLFPS